MKINAAMRLRAEPLTQEKSKSEKIKDANDEIQECERRLKEAREKLSDLQSEPS